MTEQKPTKQVEGLNLGALKRVLRLAAGTAIAKP